MPLLRPDAPLLGLGAALPQDGGEALVSGEAEGGALMTAEAQAKLAALRHRTTRYELALTNMETGEKRRLCYSARNNRSGLIAAIRSHGEELVVFAKAERFVLNREPTAQLGAWRIGFTGRTQREAISSGSELRWFAASDAK